MKYYMIDSMSAGVGGLYFAQIGDTQGMTKQIVEMTRLESLVNQELLKLRRCSPNCTREDMK